MRIQVKLKPTWWDKPPMVKILFDGNQLYDNSIETDTEIDFSVNEDGLDQSNLDICLYNKTVDQTQVDGSLILKDQLLYIESVIIDDVELGNLIFSAVYTPEYPEHMISQSPPETLTTIDTMGFNGRWRLAFTHPFQIWYLENMP